MNDQRVLGHFETLKNTGTVELSTSRGKLIFLFLLTLVFTLIGLGMMFAAYGQAPTIGDMLTSGSFWIGLLAVVFFGVFGIPSLLSQIVQKRQFVLDKRGFRYGKPHSIGTDPELEVKWDEVEGMGLARVSRSTMVAMKLTPQGYERYESRLTGNTRRLAKANERMMGEGMIALPATIGNGPQELVTLLGLAHGQYGPPEVREQYAQRQAEAQAEADAHAAARDPRAERPRASDPQE